jgi:hypothetical protein
VPGCDRKFAHCSALIDAQSSVDRQHTPGTAEPRNTQEWPSTWLATMAMTRRHLGCIGNPSKITDTPMVVHQRPVQDHRHTDGAPVSDTRRAGLLYGAGATCGRDSALASSRCCCRPVPLGGPAHRIVWTAELLIGVLLVAHRLAVVTAFAVGPRVFHRAATRRRVRPRSLSGHCAVADGVQR